QERQHEQERQGEQAETELLLGYEPDLSGPQARAAVRHLLAMAAARYPVRVAADEAAGPLNEMLDALLSEQLAQVVTSTTLVATDCTAVAKSPACALVRPARHPAPGAVGSRRSRGSRRPL